MLNDVRLNFGRGIGRLRWFAEVLNERMKVEVRKDLNKRKFRHGYPLGERVYPTTDDPTPENTQSPSVCAHRERPTSPRPSQSPSPPHPGHRAGSIGACCIAVQSGGRTVLDAERIRSRTSRTRAKRIVSTSSARVAFASSTRRSHALDPPRACERTLATRHAPSHWVWRPTRCSIRAPQERHVEGSAAS